MMLGILGLALTKTDYHWLSALGIVIVIGGMIDMRINRNHPKIGDSQRQDWALGIAMFAMAGVIFVLMLTPTKAMVKHNQKIDTQISSLNHQMQTTQQQMVIDQTQANRAKTDKSMYQYLNQKFSDHQKINDYQKQIQKLCHQKQHPNVW